MGTRTAQLVAVVATFALATAGCGAGSSERDAATQDPAADMTTTTTSTTSTTTTTTLPPTTVAPTTTATPADPPCTKAALEKAWNAKHNQKGYRYTADEAPTCDGDVAAMQMTSTMPDEMGNPDFGTYTFVARDGAWQPLARYRAMDRASILKDDALASLTASQKKRLAAIASN